MYERAVPSWKVPKFLQLVFLIRMDMERCLNDNDRGKGGTQKKSLPVPLCPPKSHTDGPVVNLHLHGERPLPDTMHGLLQTKINLYYI
jgi:hypothetical protein